MPVNEADTRADLIDPKLNRAGWTRSKVTREHYYRPDWKYTAGRVVLRGGKAECLPARKIDYLLRYTESFPIAVVEAKDEEKAAVVGLEQAKEYAKDNGLMFAYSTNGHDIIEWDGFTNFTHCQFHVHQNDGRYVPCAGIRREVTEDIPIIFNASNQKTAKIS